MTTIWLLVAQAACTWFLTGLIWTIQLVHYPLFSLADPARYSAFAAAHGLRITPLVGPPMLFEATIAIWLVVSPPANVPPSWTWIGLALVVVIWASTAWLQVPQHNRLAAGFDPRAHAWLVGSNWVRTIAWSLRGALAAAMVVRQVA